MIKLIVSDLDGTLLTKFKSVSKENQDAILEAQQKGIIVALATGRGYDSTHQFAKMFDFAKYNGYLVTNNGQRVIDVKNDVTTINGYISVEEAQAVLSFAQKHNLQLVLDSDQGFAFYTPKNLRIYRDIYRLLIKLLPIFRPILNRIHIFALFGFLKHHQVKIINTAEDITHPYDKMGLAHTKASLDRSFEELFEQFDGKLEVMRVGEMWIDVSPKGLTKVVGIRQIMEKHGIQDDEVLVMGDSDNDVTMLAAFPHGVAMGNANANARKAAKLSTKANSEHGVAHAIRTYALKS